MLSGGQLAGGNSASQKAENDFYTTDPKTVELFLDRFIADGNKLTGMIWEPACGTGNITKVLQGYLPPPYFSCFFKRYYLSWLRLHSYH